MLAISARKTVSLIYQVNMPMAGCKNQLIMKYCSKFLVSSICQNICITYIKKFTTTTLFMLTIYKRGIRNLLTINDGAITFKAIPGATFLAQPVFSFILAQHPKDLLRRQK